jgi:predicted Na+-dependent transporter
VNEYNERKKTKLAGLASIFAIIAILATAVNMILSFSVNSVILFCCMIFIFCTNIVTYINGKKKEKGEDS